MSPEEWTYLVVLLISIPIGFVFKKAGESGSLPNGKLRGWGRLGRGLPGRFQAYGVPSPCRTWAEEMGGSSCGPGAYLVHLWPPHFAFSDHHPWDLGPHPSPALVRIWWGSVGRGEQRGMRKQPVSSFLLLSLGVSCLSLNSLCLGLFFFLSCLFFWVSSLCV